ncbi:arginine repressor, partial [Enterococcus faecium]
MKKKQRQALIRQIITEQPIGTQEELLARLHEAGADVTQATISRDIREMKLVKSQNENKIVRYTLFNQPSVSLNEERLRTAIRREVLRIQSVQFMVIVLTERNGADVVTNWLDEVAYPEVVGTMA